MRMYCTGLRIQNAFKLIILRSLIFAPIDIQKAAVDQLAQTCILNVIRTIVVFLFFIFGVNTFTKCFRCDFV